MHMEIDAKSAVQKKVVRTDSEIELGILKRQRGRFGSDVPALMFTTGEVIQKKALSTYFTNRYIITVST